MVEMRPGYGVRLEAARRLLQQHAPAAITEAGWPDGIVRLSAYLGQVELPTEIPGRVRCLVTDGERLLVTWDLAGHPDCFPGGGVEPGESVAETAGREVWEETGWHIDIETIDVLGWIHIESLAEPRADLPFPHPDGFMTVVRASPSCRQHNREGWKDVDGHIARSAFVPLHALPDRIKSNPVSCVFLDAVFGDRWSLRK